jgi:Protein of unknown function DUF262
MESLSRPVAEARSVSELVEQARKGKLRIPPFQRRFRWHGTDIERLFDSIRRGYPIGSLLLWEREALPGVVEFGPLKVEAPEDDAALWVVDGQQRLTSIVGVLAGPHRPGSEFDLYFDLSSGEFKRPGSRRPRPDWVPLRRVVDTNEFVNWLLEFREDGASDEQVQAVTELGNQIRDYKIPISLVRQAQEHELRDIFDRMNNFGRRLTRAEVFQSLHSADGSAEPADLRALVEEVSDLGFGSLQEDTVLRAVLAVRGGDPYRDFRREFKADEDPAASFVATSKALRLTVDFLQGEAHIPHLRALPYVYVVPALTRFFSLHDGLSQRNMILLRRWVWRDAAAGGSGGSGAAPVLRRAVQAIDENESGSIQRLLALAPADADTEIDLSSHQLNRAAGRINLALLAQLNPLELQTGEPVDVAALLDGGEFLRIPAATGKVGSIASVFLHPPLRDDEIAETLFNASAESLASHGLSREDVTAVFEGGPSAVILHREVTLGSVLEARLTALTEPKLSDRPAISTLLVSDPEV